MKIMEVIPHLQSGGGEKFVVDLVNEFAITGNECIIVTLYDPSSNDILRTFIRGDVTQYSLGKKSGADILCMYRLLKIIMKEKPDIVHTHLEATTYSFISSIVCSPRFYATLHSEASLEAETGLHKLFRKIAFRFKFITPVTISLESEKSFEHFYGYPATMIPNGSSSYINQSDKDYSIYKKDIDCLFVHAGRIHVVKNQIMLVKAINELIKKGNNIRLVIAGRIDDDSCFSEIKPFLSDRIVYIGEISDVRSLIKEADAFCLSSNMEGMPITIIEAFSVGCPVISTPVGGCINMIQHGENGLLANSLSEDDYVSVLDQFLLKTRDEQMILKNKAKESFIKYYSIQNCSEKYIRLFCSE